MPTRLRAAGAAATATLALVTGCAGSPDPVVTPVAASPRTTTASPSPSTTGLPTGAFVLGLGDSVPGAGGPCERGEPVGCRSYVLVLGDLMTAALGRPVAAVNLAEVRDETSLTLLRRLNTDDDLDEAVAKATLVTIQVGNNDWQGPCLWVLAAECLEKNRVSVAANVDKILARVTELRGGRTAGVRVLTYADTTGENPGLVDDWQMAGEDLPAFHTMFTAATRKLADSLCAAARKHRAVCIDLFRAVNGPDGATVSDLGGIHPDLQGHERIAALVAEAGFADLR